MSRTLESASVPARDEESRSMPENPVDGRDERLALATDITESREVKLPDWIVKREEWRAAPTKNPEKQTHYPEPLKDTLNFIVVHHSAEAKALGPKEIQDSQMRRGFDDLAYHFVISPDGTVYEGRKIFIMGGHAGQSEEANHLAKSVREGSARQGTSLDAARRMDPDYGAIGILLEGMFDGQAGDYHAPTTQQEASLKILLEHLQHEYKIPKRNILRHKDVEHALVEGKGFTFTGNETDCPGNFDLRRIKQELPSDEESLK